MAKRYGEQAEKCTLPFLYRAMELSNRCDLDYRISNNKQFLVELTLIQICQITNPVTSAPENPPLQKITPAPNAGQTVSPTTQTPNTTTSQQTAGTTSGVTQTAEPQAAYRAATIRPTTFKRDIPAAPTQTRKAAPPTRISIHQNRRICRRGKHIDRTNRTRYTIHSRSPYHSLAGIRQNHTDRSRARQYDAELPPTARRPQEFRSVGRFPNSSGHINEHFHELMSFLQNALKNNQFSMQLRINQPGEKEIIFSPKDVLMKMIEKNPDIKNLYDTFNLEIA